MSSVERDLGDALADGRITEDDADAVRGFSAFLHECGPKPGSKGYDCARFFGAMRRNMPDEYEATLAQAKPEQQARIRELVES